MKWVPILLLICLLLALRCDLALAAGPEATYHTLAGPTGDHHVGYRLGDANQRRRRPYLRPDGGRWGQVLGR